MRRLTILTVCLFAGLAAMAADSQQGVISNEVIKKVDPSVVAIQHERAGGSGFIISAEGHILTNGHVVFGGDMAEPTEPAKLITVVLNDERKFPAKVIGFSLDPDVALIKIDAGEQLRPVEIGKSRDVQIGQKCFAAGAPVGLKRTFTAGILSNVDRTDLGTFTKVMQTDAAINPGNSGGPLFDEDGRVLGLNTYGSRGRNNLGFTIPIHVALVLRDHYLENGRFIRAELPLFVMGEMYDELASTLGVEKGILIQHVMANSPAYRAGLRSGDVITATDGKQSAARTLGDLLDYQWEMTIRKPGTRVTYSILRGLPEKREKVEVTATLRAHEPLPRYGHNVGEMPEYSYDALGLRFRRIVWLMRLIHAMPDSKGVMVAGATRQATAGEAGLSSWDVITHVNGAPVASVGEFRNTLEAELASRSKAIPLTVVRRSITIHTALAPFYGLEGKRAALIVPSRDVEYAEMIRRELIADGAEVVLASPSGGQVETDDEVMRSTVACSTLKGADLDLIVLAGGDGSRELWKDDATLKLIRDAHGAKSVLAAVGPASIALLLAEKKLLETKITTAKEDSGEAMKLGAKYTGKNVEKDGKVITTTGFDKKTVKSFVESLRLLTMRSK